MQAEYSSTMFHTVSYIHTCKALFASLSYPHVKQSAGVGASGSSTAAAVAHTAGQPLLPLDRGMTRLTGESAAPAGRSVYNPKTRLLLHCALSLHIRCKRSQNEPCVNITCTETRSVFFQNSLMQTQLYSDQWHPPNAPKCRDHYPKYLKHILKCFETR